MGLADQRELGLLLMSKVSVDYGRTVCAMLWVARGVGLGSNQSEKRDWNKARDMDDFAPASAS